MAGMNMQQMMKQARKMQSSPPRKENLKRSPDRRRLCRRRHGQGDR